MKEEASLIDVGDLGPCDVSGEVCPAQRALRGAARVTGNLFTSRGGADEHAGVHECETSQASSGDQQMPRPRVGEQRSAYFSRD